MGVVAPESDLIATKELAEKVHAAYSAYSALVRTREEEEEEQIRRAQEFADSIIADCKAEDDHIASLEAQPSAPIPPPPLNAEFLLHLLLRHDEHDAIIGDLIERYGKKCARLGRSRANFWFYAEVFWTALPLIKRALLKVSGMMSLAEFVRRHIS